jgi:hypothetical protein
MHKNATKCNKTQSKWCINKHGASKIIDTFETYHFSGRDCGGKSITGHPGKDSWCATHKMLQEDEAFRVYFP